MRMKWKLIACLIFVFILGLVLPIKAYAHGAKIEYTVDIAIEIVATYDNGEPMAGAQVTVYAPDDPSTPWLTGVCNDEGRFSFIPVFVKKQWFQANQSTGFFKEDVTLQKSGCPLRYIAYPVEALCLRIAGSQNLTQPVGCSNIRVIDCNRLQ